MIIIYLLVGVINGLIAAAAWGIYAYDIVHPHQGTSLFDPFSTYFPDRNDTFVHFGVGAGFIASLLIYVYVRVTPGKAGEPWNKNVLKLLLFSSGPLLAYYPLQASYNFELPPTDASLSAEFHFELPFLSEIAKMAGQDPHLLCVSGPESSGGREDSDGVSGARELAYRRLIEDADLPYGISTQQDEVDFVTYQGDVDEGYAYISWKPTNIVSSIDSIANGKDNGSTEYYYHHITGNWYIYCQTTDPL
jgi:hypothetical protein